MENSKDKILKYLKEACEISYTKYYIAGRTPFPKQADNVWLDSRPRILLPLSGTKSYTINSGDFDLKRGDVVISPRGGWVTSRWEHTHRVLSVIFWEHTVRVIYYEQKQVDFFRDSPDIYYHTQYPMQGLGKEILSSLFSEKYQISTLLTLLESLLKITYEFVEQDVPKKNGKSWNTWQSINNYIHENCHLLLTRNTIAESFKIHPSHISRLCRKHTGKSFKEYSTELRLKYSVELLRQTNKTIGELAFLCGYDYASHYVRNFKLYFGITPSEYRLKNRK